MAMERPISSAEIPVATGILAKVTELDLYFLMQVLLYPL